MDKDRPNITLNDALWKSSLETFVEPFLWYFFPGLAKQLDFSQPDAIRFLNKELENIYPEYAGARKADIILELNLQEKIHYILVHVEVQGKPDITFPKRMFTYFYRLLDRYDRPINALAILTDKDKKFHPTHYLYTSGDTRLKYEFGSFKVLEKSKEELYKAGNIFSYVLLATQQAILQTRDGQAFALQKIKLIRQLLKEKFTEDQIRQMFNFIRKYGTNKKPDIVSYFDRKVVEFTKPRKPMNIEETIIAYYKEEAEREGVRKGQQKTLYKTAENLLKEKVDINIIARATGLTLDKINEIANTLNKNQ